ncbi:MAG TPA: tetratricopeptide repeat protein, partial [Longimicrobiaceae bacterium]|nr:tetratricopeptide repeat protein [Longimicrobiaceae bacterium]
GPPGVPARRGPAPGGDLLPREVRVGAANDEVESALKPLRKASGAADALRAGTGDAAERRAAVVQLAAAMEASLRRLLRDDPHVPLEVRLSALAPDELPTAELVAELRRRDRVSIELAAAFHELGARARALREGAEPEPADAELALRLAERLEWEADAPPRPPVPSPEEPVFAEEDPLVHAVPPASRMPRGGGLAWSAAALALVLLAAVAWWVWSRGAGDRALEEGIALFRAGQAEAAVPHFRRAVQEDPEDPRPRLFLARIYRDGGRLNEARMELRRALDEAPEDPGLNRELGFLLLDAGRPDLAVPRFRQAVTLDRESVAGWVGLVRALRAAGRPDAAERILADPSTPPDVRAHAGSPAPAAPPLPATTPP